MKPGIYNIQCVKLNIFPSESLTDDDLSWEEAWERASSKCKNLRELETPILNGLNDMRDDQMIIFDVETEDVHAFGTV